MGLHCVIGSGPAGVACAKALLERGRDVLMLDAGMTLEPERARFVESFAKIRPESWKLQELADYQAGVNADTGGVLLKLVYGSDFPYRGAEEHLGLSCTHVGVRASLARGGLSNVWGAAMLPYIQQDVQDWPLPVSALGQHYSAVLELTGLSATRDALEEHFPLYSGRFTELLPSAQARQMLETMSKHRQALAEAGIWFGRSRLAVRGSSASPHRPPTSGGPPCEDGGGSGCVYCRLCMFGCPYGYIYNSADTLAALRTHPRFGYQPGVIVVSVRESAQGVEVSGYERQTREPLRWQCEKVFLAAGVIPTGRILLRSLSAYDQTVWLKDSQYFLAPLVLLRRVPGATREWLHALSQAFIEIFDSAPNGKTTHIQIYSYNDLIGQAVDKAFGILRRPLGFVARALQERMLIAQGYLHSDYSSRISIRLKKEPSTGQDRLELRAEFNRAAKARIRQTLSKLLWNSRRIGAVALPFMTKVAEPGRSFHCGGSFPMSRCPGPFQTDLLGRVPGWQRIHAVDATVLPSIPATTVTLSVMANAHRIGWEAATL